MVNRGLTYLSVNCVVILSALARFGEGRHGGETIV